MFYSFTKSKLTKGFAMSALLAATLAMGDELSAQNFIRNDFIEGGINNNGAMGAGVTAPAGYHPLGGSGSLSMVADPANDGWTVGVPTYFADYFYPGSPHEGWRIQVGANRARAYIGGGYAIEAGAGAITGTLGTVTTVGGTMTSTWTGAYNGLSIQQKSIVRPGTNYIEFEVTITNPTGATINDIYYERSNDPDHGTSTSGSGTPTTINNIAFQPTTTLGTDPKALVTFALTSWPVLSRSGLYAFDCRARVFYMTSSLTPTASLANMWTGTGSNIILNGSTATTDVGVGVVFNVGSLAPGQSTKLRYCYITKITELDNVYADMYATWDVNGVAHPNSDTIVSCMGATYDVEITSNPDVVWGTWTPTTGLSSTTGRTNTINITSEAPITYSVIGTYNGCIIDTAFITFIPLDDTVVVDYTICDAGGSYTWGGTTYTTEGTYYHEFTNMLGCDSVVQLNIHTDPVLFAIDTVVFCNGYSDWPYMWLGSFPVFGPGTSLWTYPSVSSGGCDSLTSLTVIVLPALVAEVNDTVCSDAVFPIFWNSMPVFGPGVHVAGATHTSVNGCDSLTWLNLYVQEAFEFDIYDTVCASSLPYIWEGTTLTSGGVRVANQEYAAVEHCDSIVYLNLHVIPDATTTITEYICPAELPYTWHGTVIPAAGVAVATQTFTGVNTCDSVVTLNLNLHPAVTTPLTATICEGSSYTFYGTDLETAGTYTHTLTSSLGCDSIISLTLTVNPIITTSSTVAICTGGSYTWGGVEYTAAGTYALTGTNAAGCDTVHNLTITVNPILTATIDETICEGSSYDFFGTSYTATGTYTHTSTAGPCDTLYTLNLTVNPVIPTTSTVEICAGGSYSYAGVDYTSAGTYPLPGTNADGCDTLHNLVITVAPIINNPVAASICGGSTYDFFGTIYSEAGVYTHTTTGDCDTIHTLTLTVDPVITTSTTEHICAGGSFLWAGVEYNTAGTYALSGTNAAGCDTVHNLTIVVDPIIEVPLTASICAGGEYDFYGSILTTAGTYNHTYTTGDCDTLYTLTLSVDPIIETSSTGSICAGGTFMYAGVAYTAAGTYSLPGTNAAGCDTIHTLTITVDPIVTTASTEYICAGGTFTWAGVDYTTAGTYALAGTNAAGCDTVHNLTIVVDPIIEVPLTASICAGGEYDFYGTILTTAGTYNHTSTDGACDTLFTLTLSVDPVIETTSSGSICAGGTYMWAGVAYTAAGTYSLPGTNAAGCDTVHILTITVEPVVTTSATENICAGGSFTWAGVEYTTAGTYALAGTNAFGCDTVHNLTIIVDPIIEVPMSATICAGGEYDFYGTTLTTAGTYNYTSTIGDCDTLYILTLSVDPVIETSSTGSICAGGTYLWAGVAYTAAGTYSLPGTNSAGCDTVHTLTITVEPVITTSSTENICAGGSFTWAGVEYSTAGTYALAGTNAFGCDTVHNLTITVDPIIEVPMTASICAGGSYDFFGTVYTAAGTYTHTSTLGDCDTLFTLNLTVDPVLVTSSTHHICAGGSYVYGGVTYSVTGTYPLPGTNAAGCDTVHNLVIFVDPITTIPMTATICSGNSYDFFGTILTTAGTYTHTSTAGDCDTLYTLDLTVTPIIESSHAVTLCAGGTYIWGGVTYSTSGVYVLPGTTTAGCDTVHTLTVNVNPVLVDSFTQFTCDNVPYDFYGTILTESGTYTHTVTSGPCDTLKVLELIVYETYDQILNHVVCESDLPSSVIGISIPVGSTSSSTFAVVPFTSVMGCDSIVTINLTVLPTQNTYIDTFLCYGTTMNFGDVLISGPGNYQRTLTTTSGCDSIIHLDVNYSPAPIMEEIVRSGCGSVEFEGEIYTESIFFIDTFTTVVAGCDSLIRTVDINVLYSPKDTIVAEICQGESYEFNGRSFNRTTTITDTFVYDNGCDSMITLKLTVNPLPNVDLQYTFDDDLICVFDTVELSGKGGIIYKYYDGFDDYISDGDRIFVMLPKAENLYYVVGYDEKGCTDTGKVVVYANGCCDMLMPNAFSPNGDGLNDTYGPVTDGHPVGYRMEIYNRYGERVFVSHKVEERWTGLFENGKSADAGTYFYIISGQCYDGTPIQFKGDVTLLR